MTDGVNISYSLNNDPKPATDAPAPVPVAFTDCDLIRVNEQMALVINRQNGNQQLLNPNLVDALTYCGLFKTADEHAQMLADTRPELQGNLELARSTLKQLDDLGMLLHAGSVCKRLNQPQPLELAPTRAFVITCDRPEAVERLLESMLRAGNLSQHESLYLVDDSRSADNQAKNRDLVHGFNIRSAKDMQYFGAEEQAELLEKLCSELPEHEDGIRFLIDPAHWQGYKTYGRSRTLALLLSVGYRAIVMDDDIICEAVLPPMRDTGMAFGSGTREAVFFQNDAEMQRSMEPAPFDALTGHASVLGQSLGTAIQQLYGGPLEAKELLGANATMANVLRPNGKVIITQCGSWGDTGTGSAHWVLNLRPDSVARLLTAPHGITAAVEEGMIWLGNVTPSIVKQAFMSQMTGLDNSELLPPYFPAFRAEDLLFGAMVEYMHHDATTLEYPWGVPHLPVGGRKRPSMREPIAGKGGINLFASHLNGMVDYKDTANPQQKLRRLADEAQRFAERESTELELDYRAALGQSHAQYLTFLGSQLEQAKELPSNTWQAYLERGVKEVQEALGKVHSSASLESEDEAPPVETFKAMAEGFSRGLRAWEAMRAAVR
ncbi:hypothetical protein [Parahalioglobus pacificus]|uniref:Uncharacterized protein n=1 Tax=Parahalioglobus pacificus TaxID=930806 RepID=A0A918XIX1_9GAMM|nr:hypothetical protein [Halioglobus pacificus]GHD33617.1 hypothetical protein GCM10007053_18180 [Halioglobus pacificus]